MVSNHDEFMELIDQLQKTLGQGMKQKEAASLKERLQQSRLTNLQVMGDCIPYGVFVCDESGKILYVNSANVALCGISAKECVGKNIDTFTTGANGLNNVVVKRVLETGEPYSSIATTYKTGIQMLSNCSPIKDQDGKLIGCVVIDKDVNGTIALTEKLRLSESKVVSYETMNERNSQVIELMTHQRGATVVHSKSDAMKDAYKLALQASKTDVTVLISGETGTGKEVIANYIYENSTRNKAPFIKVNCAAIPDNLLESELFGYEKGAFTGAGSKGKPGMFELAHGGTIFLDEIGELPLEFQAKLLRAISQHEIMRVGGTTVIRLDVRIQAATNKDLSDMVSKGTFREDLFYRLNIFPIGIPALRERVEDIPIFIEHFLLSSNEKYKKNIILGQDVVQKLSIYEWPGNIRELENLIERWVVIYDAFTIVSWDMVKSYFNHSKVDLLQSRFEGMTYKAFIENQEREMLIWAHKNYKTTREMAKALKIDHSTIVRKARALGINLKGESAI